MNSDTSIFSIQEYKTGLLFRIIMFIVFGIFWDVMVTFSQQIIAGALDIHLINPCSTWMIFIYGTIPLILYPVVSVMKKMQMPYLLKVLGLLVLFYISEYFFGWFFNQFGIKPWSYDWFIPEQYNIHGFITFHPVILAEWVVFVILIDIIDFSLRKSYPRLLEVFREYE